jgi:hypothetical protein
MHLRVHNNLVGILSANSIVTSQDLKAANNLVDIYRSARAS